MNEDELFREVEQTLTDYQSILDHEDEHVWCDNFRDIEAQLYKDHGMEESGDIYLLSSAAESATEVEQKSQELPADATILTSSRLKEGDIPNRAFAMILAARGDIYELFSDRYASFLIASKDDVQGILLRLSCWESAKAMEENVAPRDASDATDAIITLMYMEDKVYACVRRMTAKDEPNYQVIRLDEYEVGSMKLIDSLIEFFILPKALKHLKPDVFSAVLKDLENEHKKSERNKPTKGENNDHEEED